LGEVSASRKTATQIKSRMNRLLKKDIEYTQLPETHKCIHQQKLVEFIQFTPSGIDVKLDFHSGLTMS